MTHCRSSRLWPALALALTAVFPSPAAGQVVEYYHLDVLGSIRAVTDQAGQVVERHDFLPFGEECTTAPCAGTLPGTNTFKFTGKERDQESGLDYFGARYYGSRLGRLSTVDPLMTVLANLSDPQRWNRYAYAKNNPVSFLDPDGRSTHTTLEGAVTAVHNDGDLSVYRAGVFAGETEIWDEFRQHDDRTGAVGDIVQGAYIEYGESWEAAIDYSNDRATHMQLPDVAAQSRGGGFFDLKRDGAMASHGVGTGRLLNGKYATVRSAGNYLAGLNMATATWAGGQRIDHVTAMKLAGMLQQKQFSKRNAWRVLALGKAFGPEPWYGEIEYSGRQIQQGFAAGWQHLGGR